MDTDIIEMLETTGGKLYFGGIAGMMLSAVLMLIFIPIFSSAKKRMIKKIDSEFDKTGDAKGSHITKEELK